MLKDAPLTSCQINASWNTSRQVYPLQIGHFFSRLADVLSIFPMRKAGKTFQNQQSSLLLMKEQRMKRMNIKKQGKVDRVMQNINEIINKQQKFTKIDGPQYARKKLRDIDDIKTTLKKLNDGQLEKFRMLDSQGNNFLDILTFNLIKERFIYPFCVEQGYATNSINKTDIVDNKQFSFPTLLQNKPQAIKQLTHPLTFTVQSLDEDMKKISAQFATKIIPQVTANNEFARDILSQTQYKILETKLPRRKTPSRTLRQIDPAYFSADYKKSYSPMAKTQNKNKVQNSQRYAMEILSPQQAGRWIEARNKALNKWQLLNPQALNVTIPRAEITKCLQFIQGPTLKRLIGLIAHFSYWKLFSHMNPLPIDKYHLRQIFVAIATCFSVIESEFKQTQTRKKFFAHFYMPTFLVAIRIQVCKLIQDAYPLFVKRNNKRVLCHINDLITHILDPNLFLSRYSLLQSRKEGIKIRNKINKGAGGTAEVRKGFYTRSALVRSVIPHPSDGKVRVLFGTGQSRSPKKGHAQRQYMANALNIEKKKRQQMETMKRNVNTQIGQDYRPMGSQLPSIYPVRSSSLKQKQFSKFYSPQSKQVANGAVTFSQLTPFKSQQTFIKQNLTQHQPYKNDTKRRQNEQQGMNLDSTKDSVQHKMASISTRTPMQISMIKPSPDSTAIYQKPHQLFNSVQTTQPPFSSVQDPLMMIDGSTYQQWDQSKQQKQTNIKGIDHSFSLALHSQSAQRKRGGFIGSENTSNIYRSVDQSRISNMQDDSVVMADDGLTAYFQKGTSRRLIQQNNQTFAPSIDSGGTGNENQQQIAFLNQNNSIIQDQKNKVLQDGFALMEKSVEDEQEDPSLNLLNRIQLFQIALDKMEANRIA